MNWLTTNSIGPSLAIHTSTHTYTTYIQIYKKGWQLAKQLLMIICC